MSFTYLDCLFYGIITGTIIKALAFSIGLVPRK